MLGAQDNTYEFKMDSESLLGRHVRPGGKRGVLRLRHRHDQSAQIRPQRQQIPSQQFVHFASRKLAFFSGISARAGQSHIATRAAWFREPSLRRAKTLQLLHASMPTLSDGRETGTANRHANFLRNNTSATCPAQPRRKEDKMAARSASFHQRYPPR